MGNEIKINTQYFKGIKNQDRQMIITGYQIALQIFWLLIFITKSFYVCVWVGESLFLMRRKKIIKSGVNGERKVTALPGFTG